MIARYADGLPRSAGMSANPLEAEVDTVTGLIVDELATDRGRPDNANESIYALGVDPTVVTVALKVVLGIAASFLGRLLYDRWKAARTRKHLDSLADEITGRLEAKLPPKVEPVDAGTLRADVLALLTQEGLSETQAQAVFDQAIAVIGERFRR